MPGLRLWLMQKEAYIMKKFAAIVLSLSMLSMLAGCGKEAAETSETEETEEVEVTETEAVEETEESKPEETEETETEATEAVPATWFEEQGLEITPQGDFDFLSEFMGDTFEGLDVHFDSNVVITESTEGCEEGYKTVTAEFAVDFTDTFTYGGMHLEVDDHPSTWISAFDRYTGISFEPGGEENPISLDVDGETYDITCTFDWSHDYDEGAVDYCTVTVTCPVDYDGTVFYIGHGAGGSSGISFDDDFDFTARSYTIDEFPCYVTNGYPYSFFSVTNE